MSRGQLTEEVAAKIRELFGDEFATTTFLRLLPFMIYTVQNSRLMDRTQTNDAERAFLRRLDKRKLVTWKRSADPLHVTEEFWNKANQIIWLAYVK